MGDFTASFQKVQNVSLLWVIVLAPLVGAAINGIFGKLIQDRFGKKANHAIAVGAMLVAAAFAVYHFVMLLGLPAGSRTLRDFVFPMMDVGFPGRGKFHVDFALTMDQLSGTMTLIITIIGSMIHVYSIGYM